MLVRQLRRCFGEIDPLPAQVAALLEREPSSRFMFAAIN
jgi:hypothetical protein